MTKLTKRYETEAHDEGIWAMCWLPDQNRLFTGAVDEQIKLWEVSKDKDQLVKLGQRQNVSENLGILSLDVNRDGEFAVSSALDSTVTVWRTDSYSEVLASIEAAPTESWTVTFGPQQDSVYLALAGGTRKTVVLWRIGDMPENYMELHGPPPSSDSRSQRREHFTLCACFSPDGSKIAASYMDGTVALWDHATGQLLGRCEGHHRPVRCIRFTHDSRLLLTACDDMHVHLYDVESRQLVEAFSGHESWVLSLSLHPSGSSFVSSGSDAKVKVWDMQARACVQTLAGDHTDQVWCVGYNTAGTLLASVADDKKLVVYSVS